VTTLLLHDLTSIKRAEQMRVDFVANASHELRTPLAAVSGFIENSERPARRGYDRAREIPRHHGCGKRRACAA